MGGLLTYGIPGFKLEKHVVQRRVDRLAEGGIVFHENFEVGRDATMDELRQRHDAILIATGVYKAKSEEHTSELQSLMRISYAVFCLNKKKQTQKQTITT